MFLFWNLFSFLLDHISVSWNGSVHNRHVFFIISDYDVRFVTRQGSASFQLLLPKYVYLTVMVCSYCFFYAYTSVPCLTLPIFLCVWYNAFVSCQLGVCPENFVFRLSNIQNCILTKRGSSVFLFVNNFKNRSCLEQNCAEFCQRNPLLISEILNNLRIEIQFISFRIL